MKKFFILVVCLLFITGTAQAKQIKIDEENGIYHIILSGNAIKKRIFLCVI